MNFNPALPVNTTIEPEASTESLFNVYQQYEEDKLSRVQSDIPIETKCYITALFGKRGNIQSIINLTFHLLEHELRSLGLAGYSPDNDAIVARILLELRGAGTRVHNPQDRPESGSKVSDADVDDLDFGGPVRRSGSGQPAAKSPADTTPPPQNGGRHAKANHQTPRDADGGSDAKGKSPKGGGRNRSQKPKREAGVA